MNRTRKVYEFIRDYIIKYGYQPSYDAIAAGVGLKSKSTVRPHLNKLEADGFIELVKVNGQVKAIKILDQDDDQ